jgi:hypothetical protein
MACQWYKLFSAYLHELSTIITYKKQLTAYMKSAQFFFFWSFLYRNILYNKRLIKLFIQIGHKHMKEQLILIEENLKKVETVNWIITNNTETKRKRVIWLLPKMKRFNNTVSCIHCSIRWKRWISVWKGGKKLRLVEVWVC